MVLFWLDCASDPVVSGKQLLWNGVGGGGGGGDSKILGEAGKQEI